jgi:hypothetical protein
LLQLEVGVWVGDDVWGAAKEEKKRRENTNERD